MTKLKYSKKKKLRYIKKFEIFQSYQVLNDENKFDFSFLEKNNFSGNKWKDCDIITLDTLFVESEKHSSSQNEDSKTSTSSANSVTDEDSRIIADEDQDMSKDFLNKKRNRMMDN